MLRLCKILTSTLMKRACPLVEVTRSALLDHVSNAPSQFDGQHNLSALPLPVYALVITCRLSPTCRFATRVSNLPSQSVY